MADAIPSQAGDHRPRGRAPRGPFTGMMKRLNVFTVIGGLLALIALALVLYPVISTYIRLLFPDWSFDSTAFDAVFSSHAFWSSLAATVVIVGISGLLALALATIFAWINERTDASMGMVSKILPLVPLLIPSIAFAIGWIFLADKRSGLLNILLRFILKPFGYDAQTGPFNITSWPGLIIVYALHLVPFAYLLISAALKNLDPALEEAARISGAGVWRLFWRVSVRSVMPSVAAAGLVIAIIGFALFSIPAIIGTPARIQPLSVLTVTLIRFDFPPRTADGVVISLVVMLLVIGLWLLQGRLQAAQRHVTVGGRAGAASVVRLGPWRWVARAGILGYILLAAVLPGVGLVVVALQPFWTPHISWARMTLSNFRSVLDDPLIYDSLHNSVVLGLVGATIGMVAAAVLITYARERRGWQATTIDVVTKLPGGISHVVIGVAFLVALGSAPFHLLGTRLILLLAYLTIYLPQASAAASSAVGQVDEQLLEAAWMSGAGRLRSFAKIMMPLIRPGLVSGWVFLWVVMLSDVTASTLLGGTSNPVFGLEILDIYRHGTYSQLAAAAALITLISISVVTVVLLYAGRGHKGQRSVKRRSRRRRGGYTDVAGTGGVADAAGAASVVASSAPPLSGVRGGAR